MALVEGKNEWALRMAKAMWEESQKPKPPKPKYTLTNFLRELEWWRSYKSN